jgi:flagellar biosynthesis GTPase FlhF
MKATNSRQFSSVAARTLKVVGIILILSALLDGIILSLPGETSEIISRGWQLAAVTVIVDRGMTPLIGIALLLTGFWVDSSTGVSVERRNFWLDLRFWALLISSLLGLIYLLLVPVHLNNTRLELKEALVQVEREAGQAEGQLEAQIKSDQFKAQIEQLKNQRRSQISALLQDDGKLQQALKSQEVPKELKAVLEQSKNDPKAVDQFLEQQAQELPNQARNEIRTRRQQKEKELRTRSRNSSLQTGIRSLLLAIGYITVGWTGLRSMGILRFGRRKG